MPDIIGTEGPDTLVGTEGEDALQGLGGDDTLRGLGGNDILEGGSGNDTLEGGTGLDLLNGGSGTDILRGGDGHDRFSYFEDGDDQMFGEAGDDSFTIDSASTVSTVHNILLDGGAGFDDYTHRSSNTLNVTFLGGDDSDVATILGDVGNSHFTLDMGAGNDGVSIWTQDPGTYEITLGSGSDQFTLGVLNTSASITITDFETGLDGDTIALAQLLLDFTSWDGVSNPFSSDSLRLVQSGADTIIEINTGSLSGPDWQKAVRLSGVNVTDLVNANFRDDFPLDGSVPTPTRPPHPPIDLVYTLLTEGDDFEGFSNADDLILGLAGNDGLVMAGGNDIVDGGDGDDIIYGQNGDDQLYGERGIDRLFGGDGDDILDGGPGVDVLVGGNGNDTLIGGSNAILGGDGGDAPFEQGGDTIYGEGGDDLIFAGAGDDTIFGGDGDDRAFGERGTDVLIMGEGNDTASGGAWHDVIYGQAGDDILDGGDGNDTIFGGSGNNTLFGGAGIDVLITEDGNDAIYGGSGNDVIYAFGGDDIVDGGDGGDTIFGGDGNDTLRGGAGDDVIADVSGNDTLDGGDGNDVVNGLAGNDRMTGGNGDNIVLGGTGADVFYQAETGIDRILDFQVGIDKIEVSSSVTSFQALIAGAEDITDTNGNSFVVLSNGDNGMFVLSNLSAADLSESDFIFATTSGSESADAAKSDLSAPVSEHDDLLAQDLATDLETDFAALMGRSNFADHPASVSADLTDAFFETSPFNVVPDSWIEPDLFA